MYYFVIFYIIFTWSYSPNNPKYDYLSPSKWQRYYCFILYTFFSQILFRPSYSKGMDLDTLSKLKKAIRSSPSMPIPRYYSYGPRKLNINFLQASFLINENFIKCLL